MSKRTSNNLAKYIVCKLMSFILCLAPLITYVIIGLANGDIQKGQKLFLGFACISAIILTVVNILFKYKLRSPLFIILLGVYYALNDILPLIVIISIGVVLDEFIFSPLAIKYKQKYVVNKEIDIRFND